MIVQITKTTNTKGEDNVPQWVMIELNGQVLPPMSSCSEARGEDNKKIIELGSFRMHQVRTRCHKTYHFTIV